ncbi:MAG: tRNA (adenosine(37)-N6)-threonylcarbamoyltransferase complex ATPase subunit type 1 TsaE [Phycisphaerales bacterium]|nr:tRNA (adenosine(37)-N6)-threonylcarbamoyltransferase complex ATPase subunit type 1 TsaE [Phycisphaerales bacterium]
MNEARQITVTHSVEETLALGRALGESLVAGLAIALVGPLGAGKTHLVKGIATGNGLADPDGVTSPTFVLANEYAGRFRLHHLDLYRLRQAAEVEALGLEEMTGENCVMVIEWADRFPDALPADTLWVHIRAGEAEGDREFVLEARGGLGIGVIARLLNRGDFEDRPGDST